MIESDGVVVRVDGDYVWVRTDGPGNACGACASKEGCQSSGSVAVLDGMHGRSGRLLRLANTIQAHPGDAVVVCASDGIVLRAVWLAYGVPLLLALAGAMIAVALTGSEVASVAGMLCGLLGGYLIMRQAGMASLGSSGSSRAEPILSISFKRSPLSFSSGITPP
jgi:sigma-E factor negative regulatory protein RseC